MAFEIINLLTYLLSENSNKSRERLWRTITLSSYITLSVQTARWIEPLSRKFQVFALVAESVRAIYLGMWQATQVNSAWPSRPG